MVAKLRISGKVLGSLALDDFCERCFWVQRQAPGGVPFQIFPGIFSSIDSYSKRVIHGAFDRDGQCPAWLSPLGPISGYRHPPHQSKFRVVEPSSGMLLTGSPDGVLVRADGSNLIVDYKTAKFTGAQDALFPMYAIQLNAYALIGASCGLAPVSGLALVYTEPVTDDAAAKAEHHRRPDGFAMSFAVRILRVELETSRIPDLLREARRILQLTEAPSGRAGCVDCAKLEGMLNVLGF